MLNSEILNTAADNIESGGWYSSGNGGDVPKGAPRPACTTNAIWHQATKTMTIDPHRALDCMHLVAEHLGVKGLGAIWSWNDAPGRTKAEVIEVLRAAAVVEELKEAEARGPLNTGPTVRVPTQPGVGVA